MSLEKELIYNELSAKITEAIKGLNFDVNEFLEIKSLNILKEIQNIISNTSLSDFEMIEEIVVLFENNGIYCGGCHDF